MNLEHAISRFAIGEIIIVTDHHDRENEGDLMFASEFVTPQKINFMTKFGRGLICVTITEAHASKLSLARQELRNNNEVTCAFTTSIDAAGIKTSGISVSDRSLAISRIAKSDAVAGDFATPGHVFPVIADPGGLRVRHGHTEASIELCLRTNCFPSAVICEILAEDGSSALTKDIIKLSKAYDLPIISIESLLGSIK